MHERIVEIRFRCVSDDSRAARSGASVSACPYEIENADQTSGFVHREYDESEVADVREPPSRHSGRRAGHGSSGSSQILASSVTSMSNACSGRPCICQAGSWRSPSAPEPQDAPQIPSPGRISRTVQGFAVSSEEVRALSARQFPEDPQR
jgi:hypothetical protein